MEFSRRSSTNLKMRLDHCQSGIEEAMHALEGNFRSWVEHPHQRALQSKILEQSVNLRWILDQYYTRMAGEGYLENVAAAWPGMYRDLREIECRQCRVIDELDHLIGRVEALVEAPDVRAASIMELQAHFRRLHADILDEESLERRMLEKGMA
jgi:hypothetical protein